MTDPVNIPDGILSSDFPAPADRTAGVFNSKALAWANSARDMSERDREIALAGRTNAVSSRESAVAADASRQQAQQARDDAQTAADDAGDSAAVVGRWDKLVLGPKDHFPTTDNDGDPLQVGAEFYHSTLLARYSWSGAEWRIGTNVTAGVESVNGNPGPAVVLGIADVVAPGDIVAYGATKEAARAAVDAGYNYERGTQTYTSSQTINRTLFGTAKYVLVELWGGGGSGAASITTTVNGGEGGHYASWLMLVESLPSSISLVIGTGGASVTANNAGQRGGDTSFAGLIAFGGVGGLLNVATATVSALGDGTGGAGGSQNSAAGASISAGGGGGSGANANTAKGVSVMAGSGGDGLFNNAAVAVVASSGAAPSGGGGGARAGTGGSATSGAGARGQARLTWW